MAKLITAQHQEAFDGVNDIAKSLRENALKTTSFRPIDTLSEWLTRLTGLFMYLTTEFIRLHVARENNEIGSYIKNKMDVLAAGEKFVSAVAERESRNSVSEFVEAEKIVESYKDAAEQGILTLKKLIEIQMLELQREAK